MPGKCTHVIHTVNIDMKIFLFAIVVMYIDRVPNRNSPPAILLRESYREGVKSGNEPSPT